MTGTAAHAVPADLDRRFYAFVADRALAWALDAAAAYVAYRALVERGHPVAGVLVVLAVVLLVGAAFAAGLGATGSSPGRAATGLRVVDADRGDPIGVARALRRQLVLGLATLPTLGLGSVLLAWTAVTDPGGRRRGWHDRISGSVVIDARPPREEPVAAQDGPRHVVNLTALRLVPAPAPAAPAAHRAEPPATPAARPTTPAPAPAPAPAPEPGADPGWRLRFDTGEEVAVTGLVLVGRQPEARPGEPVRHLVALRSADLSLSKTHAELRLDAAGGLVVVDRGSTNGSVLVRRGAARELAPGRPTTLLACDVLRLGDREAQVSRRGAAELPTR